MAMEYDILMDLGCAFKTTLFVSIVILATMMLCLGVIFVLTKMNYCVPTKRCERMISLTCSTLCKVLLFCNGTLLVAIGGLYLFSIINGLI